VVFGDQFGEGCESGKLEGTGVSEETKPPGLLDCIRSTLEFKTGNGDGASGGTRITGIETIGQQLPKPPVKGSPGFYWFAVARDPSSVDTKGISARRQAQGNSRQPKDPSIKLEQISHLMYKHPVKAPAIG
jgi:hypothetical protein